MAGEVRIQTVVQLIKFGGYRQFSVPKPPLLLAAKRCMPCKKKANAQIAHLVFADTQANAEKPKELFLANA